MAMRGFVRSVVPLRETEQSEVVLREVQKSIVPLRATEQSNVALRIFRRGNL